MSDLDVYDGWVERLDAPTRQHVERMNGRISDLMTAIAAERARAERAERERDAAVKVRLDWQADYDREKRQLHAMIDDARQRAEAAEGREARLRECVKDALDCLPRALDGSSPFSLSQRAEVMLAIESLNRALAGTPEGEQREGQGDE